MVDNSSSPSGSFDETPDGAITHQRLTFLQEQQDLKQSQRQTGDHRKQANQKPLFVCYVIVLGLDWGLDRKVEAFSEIWWSFDVFWRSAMTVAVGSGSNERSTVASNKVGGGWMGSKFKCS
ncbi:hypothetical protein COLO4_15198 [Corchorus olitorius]|uniref:Uncharacterized protein n=1 Tax=Corchorus olitorius TaxID=93759 RepID=A0A1R3JP24_9ROSI|nr:hypothetical protein COLO4_15198 [Corchorus olitorius]